MIAPIARLLQTKIGRDLPKIGRSRMRRCFFSFCDCLSKAGYLLADCCLAWNSVPNPPLAPPGNLFGMAVLGCIFSRWVQGHLDAGRAGSRAMQTIVGPRSSFRAAVVVARPRKDAKTQRVLCVIVHDMHDDAELLCCACGLWGPRAYI